MQNESEINTDNNNDVNNQIPKQSESPEPPEPPSPPEPPEPTEPTEPPESPKPTEVSETNVLIGPTEVNLNRVLSKIKTKSTKSNKTISKIKHTVRNIPNSNYRIVTRRFKHRAHKSVSYSINIRNTYNIHVVYFINCLLNKNYLQWVNNQLNLVKNWKAKFYIIAIIHKKKKEFIRKVKSKCPNAKIIFFNKDEYEYRGILQVWKLGQVHNKKNDIILYFHSKGVTRRKQYRDLNSKIWTGVIKNIEYIKEIFDIFPSVSKIGAAASTSGFMWWNFWFARGSYINKVEKPKKTNKRHYYEYWLAHSLAPNKAKYNRSVKNCYSINNGGISLSGVDSKYAGRLDRGYKK